MNYDYGGVWARIPTPENLRIIRYYGGGGRGGVVLPTPSAVPEIHSQRLPPPHIHIMDIIGCTLEAKKASIATEVLLDRRILPERGG